MQKNTGTKTYSNGRTYRYRRPNQRKYRNETTQQPTNERKTMRGDEHSPRHHTRRAKRQRKTIRYRPSRDGRPQTATRTTQSRSHTKRSTVGHSSGKGRNRIENEQGRKQFKAESNAETGARNEPRRNKGIPTDATIRGSKYTKIKFYTRTVGNGIIPGRTNRHRRRRRYYGPNKRETPSQRLPPQETNCKLKNTPPTSHPPKKARPSNTQGHFCYKKWHYTKERPFTLNFIMSPSFDTYRLNPRGLTLISPIFQSSRPPGRTMKTLSANIPTSYTPPPTPPIKRQTFLFPTNPVSGIPSLKRPIALLATNFRSHHQFGN